MEKDLIKAAKPGDLVYYRVKVEFAFPVLNSTKQWVFKKGATPCGIAVKVEHNRIWLFCPYRKVRIPVKREDVLAVQPSKDDLRPASDIAMEHFDIPKFVDIAHGRK